LIDLVVLTCGREYLSQTLASAEEHLKGDITHRLMFDDSGDSAYREWLRQFGFEVVPLATRQLGYMRAMTEVWNYLSTHAGSDKVFHLEDDFIFERDVHLDEMSRLLDTQPHLAQVVLLRHPFYPRELRAGGIVEEHPESYTQRDEDGIKWLEHDLFFSLNPCMYRRELTKMGWPAGRKSEKLVGPKLTAQGKRFAFLGHGELYATHIGKERAGEGLPR
jgi:hypothetical protein